MFHLMNNKKWWTIFFISLLTMSFYITYLDNEEIWNVFQQLNSKLDRNFNGNPFKNQSKSIKMIIEPTTKKPSKTLPEVAIARRVWHKYNGKKWNGLQLPILVSSPGGGLGNVMGEYATLYALGRIYGATVRLLPAMKNILSNIFPNVTMELIPGKINTDEWKRLNYLTFRNYGNYEAAASGLMGPGRFILTGWPFEIQLFNTYREDIRREFTFSPKIQQQVKEYWDKNKRNLSTTLVGIHVRRTDYVNHIKMFKSSLPGGVYFKKATDYYRTKYTNVTFVVASDNMAYVKKTFRNYTDVIFAPGSPKELDMAVLASCNHSIITVGSYGFWSAYLAGGEVIYPNLTTREDYQFERNWYQLGHLDFFTPLFPF